MNKPARVFIRPIVLSMALGTAALTVVPALAQFSNPEPAMTEVHNAAPLRPPAGARAAIVEWEDLECPDCAHANPMLKEAAEKYHIPWVRHDFPLPFHTWSFEAAVDARWFDTHSRQVGDAFRDALFAAQPTIHSQEDLRAFAAQFAQQHGLRMPADVDPQGRLADRVKADYALGQGVGIQHTPTIWVVTGKGSSDPFVEVVDRSRLDALIEQALGRTAKQ